MRCFLCRDSRFAFVSNIQGRQIVKCKKDGLILSVVKAKPHKSPYGRTYYHVPAHSSLFDSYWPYFKQKLAVIRSKTRIKMPHVLDIGCGWGEFLEVLRRHRINYLGIDTSNRSISICKKKGLNARRKQIQNLKTGKKRYDAISMFQVIEHIENPLPVLRAALKLLKKGGILLITTPNHESPIRKILKQNWSVYHDPTHVAFYDKKTLKTVLKKAGFRKSEVKNDAWRFISLSHVIRRLHVMFPSIINLPPWLVIRLSIPIP